LEFEDIIIGMWTTNNYSHNGKYWQVDMPALRPKVYQQPHPPIIRACSGLASTLEMARQGRPFLMNIQSNAVTTDRINQYKNTMSRSGFNDEMIADRLSDSWVWRNVFVSDTNKEAAAIGIPCFREMRAYLSDNRSKLNTSEELRRQRDESSGAARDSVDYGLIYGSPEKVSEELSDLGKTGIGGIIIHFRLGPMPWEATENSLRLFSEKVIPAYNPTEQTSITTQFN
jgi:alkanesulfonate monooxygenase SsuD/methylene tetrahydromethanopterin reductase-like flavin-dependent oxidoreductase (luciferase family)